MMSFTALPLAMALTKYAVLLLVIAVLVPGVIMLLEWRQPMKVLTTDGGATCEMVRLRPPC